MLSLKGLVYSETPSHTRFLALLLYCYMMNYILMNGGKKYKVVQTLGAGLKFDNYCRLSHGFFDEKKGSGDRKTVACVATVLLPPC